MIRQPRFARFVLPLLLSLCQPSFAAELRAVAEARRQELLLEDSPVIPLLCRGGSYQLAEGYTGLYRAPDGVFFLYGVHREATEG